MNGEGIIMNNNGIKVYDGKFIDGLKHGKGTLRIDDKFEYKGDFERDLMQGEGVLTLMREK